MSKKDPEERRRKKKREEQKRRANVRPTESLAYLGSKYQKEKFIPAWMQTEIGIYETYVITDRELCDQTVKSAIENLIRQLRAGPLPPLPEGPEIDYDVGREDELLIANVRRRWREFFATEWRPPKDDLIGILRTILGSLEKVRTPDPHSQGYLRHIAGFLTKKLGVTVQRITENREPIPEPEEDPLLRLGRHWHTEGDQEARAEFFELAAQQMKTGRTGQVAEACQLLIGEISDPESAIVAELFALLHQVRQSLVAARG